MFLEKKKKQITKNALLKFDPDLANKRDWDLRQELNDDKLWKDWMSARRRICSHYKSKHFGQGTVKPLMVISCEMRLNTEATRYCINGEDKQCG